jgi:transcriptional regulator with XRE-family HTH domain
MSFRFPANPQQRRRPFIKEWRQHRGLTQTKLADAIGISKPSLSRIENARQPYSQDILEALAKALNTDPASLIGRDPTRLSADLWDVWEKLRERDRPGALDVLQVLAQNSRAQNQG